MPEGPEIRRAADRLAEAVLGERLVSVTLTPPALVRYGRRLTGSRIEAITPHGKALLTRFDNGLTLYSHNQLYGVWKIVPAGQRPATRRALRVALETRHRAILLYSASDLSVWPSDRVHEHPFLRRLGPDVLDPALTAAAVRARLGSPAFAGRRLAGLLLDQGFLAGLGNYLRAEILFAARLAPEQRPQDLSGAEGLRLARALLAVPRHSYRTRERQAGAQAGPSGTRSGQAPGRTRAAGFRFQVFERTGEACTRCGRPIERSRLAGRPFYRCPACQTRR